MLYARLDTKGSNDFPQHSDKTWFIFVKCSHFANQYYQPEESINQHHSVTSGFDFICSTAAHTFFSHFLSTELCSLDFKSVFPIVSLENTRKKVLGWWRLAKLQPSQWASAEALALCECSQRLFIYCRDAGLCGEVTNPQCVSSLKRL